MDLVTITEKLADDMGRLVFSSPVAHVYNPLVYARVPHERYLTRYGTGWKEVVFVGMNPGPWGMAQTGVPFGEVEMVRGWLGIGGEVEKPQGEHPRKPVEGFSCRRSEVSGRRLWGLFRSRCGDAERFFERFFVINYCPLLFLDADGRNITPDKLKRVEQESLLAACDTALRRSVAVLDPGRVVGIGNFAAARAEAALTGLDIPVGRMLHPSPASPAANRNWEEKALMQLEDQGLEL
jgi:single-strand selective monofunctional uracil DNA glycosylase